VSVEQFYSPKEAALKLSLSEDSLLRHIARLNLPSKKVGHRRLIPESTLKALLNEEQQPHRLAEVHELRRR
jgi:excisionase family DNA binding protein